jgi:hypothetical protein
MPFNMTVNESSFQTEAQIGIFILQLVYSLVQFGHKELGDTKRALRVRKSKDRLHKEKGQAKRQTTIYKALKTKLKIEQHESH